MSKRGGWRGKRKRDDDQSSGGPGPGRKPDDDPMDMVPKAATASIGGIRTDDHDYAADDPNRDEFGAKDYRALLSIKGHRVCLFFKFIGLKVYL